MPFERVTEEYFDWCFDTNVKSAFFTVQKLAPLMPPGGSIILTGIEPFIDEGLAQI